MHRVENLGKLSLQEFLYRFPLHPFLFAAYPIIALLGLNIEQVYAREATASLMLSLSTTAVTLVVFWLLF